SQRMIAALVGQSQSEVSEIVNGRQVQAYAVLHRICTGLGVPHEAMGLSSGDYPGNSPVAELSEEDEAEVLRRQFDHLFAVTGVAVLGTATGLGRFLGPTALPPGQLLAVPARVGRADVEAIREVTAAVAEAARTVGGQAGLACSLAEWADRFLTAEASDAARRALLSALADLHVIVAWCCHDSYAPIPAHQHFSRAVELATEAGDTYRVSYALRYAAGMLIDRGQPTRALKLASMAEYNLANAPREDPRVAPLRSGLVVVSALAQAQLAAPVAGVQARRVRSALARSRDGYEPPSLHHRASMDHGASEVHLHLGELDTAESLATAAARTHAEGNHGREGVRAGITVARVHLLAGEPDAGQRAVQTIEAVLPLRSSVARTQLALLAQDLHTRPDLAELARRAQQVATTRM
ncbi:MAG: helix-turn-helix domain-containing protein, partial [Pseudonocardiaceae bacterium]